MTELSLGPFKPSEPVIFRRVGNGGWVVMQGSMEDPYARNSHPVILGAFSSDGDMLEAWAGAFGRALAPPDPSVF